ncbi:dihydrolipoyl dehydrogenase [Martelella limonii]|uniref:dihydrolipoyl dehydrogenase n=1 Tax=Martelella limonii TaxID=1647649 RepID=UPI00157FD635|nr:dihydrolipoyl dehydrogenase [Martelella limonii]
MSEDFDLLVIGAGPGGYACAIRAARLGLKTACVDERATLGGTCLNVGCIPSKALLHATALYEAATGGHMADFGIRLTEASVDLEALMGKKDEIIGSLTRGIDFLFRKNGVTRLTGRAVFQDDKTVSVGDRRVRARSIVIATGSAPRAIKSVVVDNASGVIVDSTGALSLPRVPGHLVVVGGGVIGLELGSVWKRLGAQVTVIEHEAKILPGMDGDVRSEMAKILDREGMTLLTSASVTDVSISNGRAEIKLTQAGASKTVDADTVLVATGRRPVTAGLGLEAIGIKVDERGFIPVDGRCRTQAENIYAIGDVTPGAMLAHRAADEGIAVAERLAGLPGAINHALIPSVIYTLPEAASVGMNEEALVQREIPFRKASFPMAANSRAKANDSTAGFVKLLAHRDTGVILGAHIVGALAGTMIAQLAQAMEFSATAEDIAYTSHAHPTHSEAVKEAAMALLNAEIHI